jgi:hypothetical protein
MTIDTRELTLIRTKMEGAVRVYLERYDIIYCMKTKNK